MMRIKIDRSRHHLIVALLITFSLFITVFARATNYNEAEMPLNLKTEQAQQKGTESSAKTVLGFVFILAVLGGTYYFVRRYANTKIPQNTLMQIKVIAQHHLGPKKSVAVIRVAGESMLVGITDNQINLIKSLSILDEDFASTAKAQLGADADLLSDETVVPGTAASEDFSFADLKTTVSAKIKSARGFQ